MRDPNLLLLLCGAILAFTAVALYASPAIQSFSRRNRLRPPHRTLITIVRIWFALLAVGALSLLAVPVFTHRH